MIGRRCRPLEHHLSRKIRSFNEGSWFDFGACPGPSTADYSCMSCCDYLRDVYLRDAYLSDTFWVMPICIMAFLVTPICIIPFHIMPIRVVFLDFVYLSCAFLFYVYLCYAFLHYTYLHYAVLHYACLHYNFYHYAFLHFDYLHDAWNRCSPFSFGSMHSRFGNNYISITEYCILSQI